MNKENSYSFIKPNNEFKRKLSDSFQLELERFQEAFEEDSIDEYLDKNPPFSPEAERNLYAVIQEIDRIRHEKIRKEMKMRPQNSNALESNDNNSKIDLIGLINPYLNKNINGDKHALRELEKLKQYLNLEVLGKNTKNSYHALATKAMNLFQEIDNRNNEAGNDDGFWTRNSEQIKNGENKRDEFIEKAEIFCENLDLSILVSEEDEEECPEFFNLMNSFLHLNKSKFSYKSFISIIEREFKNILEKLDKNKGRIMSLIEKSFNFFKYSSQKEMMKLREKALTSTHHQNNNKDETEEREKTEFYCTIKHCDRVYSTKHSLKVHFQKHHLNERYECPICYKKFKSHTCCKQHIKKHHSEHGNIIVSLGKNI